MSTPSSLAIGARLTQIEPALTMRIEAQEADIRRRTALVQAAPSEASDVKIVPPDPRRPKRFSRQQSRREVLSLAGAGMIGAGAALLGAEAADAANNDPITVGNSFSGTNVTTINVTSNGGDMEAFRGIGS